MTTMSKVLSDSLKGTTAFQSMCHDYTDHAALTEKPLSLKDFFEETTFYHGHGDWPTFKKVQEDMGNKPAIDSYLV